METLWNNLKIYDIGGQLLEEIKVAEAKIRKWAYKSDVSHRNYRWEVAKLQLTRHMQLFDL